MPKCISLAQECPENSKFFHGQVPSGNLPLERLTTFKTQLPTSSTPTPNLLYSQSFHLSGWQVYPPRHRGPKPWRPLFCIWYINHQEIVCPTFKIYPAPHQFSKYSLFSLDPNTIIYSQLLQQILNTSFPTFPNPSSRFDPVPLFLSYYHVHQLHPHRFPAAPQMRFYVRAFAFADLSIWNTFPWIFTWLLTSPP